MKSDEMFQPNSIRSLLSRRTTSRVQSAQLDPKKQEPIPSLLDNDYESIMETKMMIKDIDNKVNNIREWRNQQRELTEGKLKCNKELAEELTKERLQSLKRQEELEKEQLKQIIQKLETHTEIKIKENDEEFDYERIYEVLSSTENLRKAFKNNSDVATSDQHQSFLRSINGINKIFTVSKEERAKQEEQMGETQENSGMELSVLLEKEKANESGNSKANKDAVKKELEEIERELKEMQELLGDEE